MEPAQVYRLVFSSGAPSGSSLPYILAEILGPWFHGSGPSTPHLEPAVPPGPVGAGAHLGRLLRTNPFCTPAPSHGLRKDLPLLQLSLPEFSLVTTTLPPSNPHPQKRHSVHLLTGTGSKHLISLSPPPTRSAPRMVTLMVTGGHQIPTCSPLIFLSSLACWNSPPPPPPPPHPSLQWLSSTLSCALPSPYFRLRGSWVYFVKSCSLRIPADVFNCLLDP